MKKGTLDELDRISRRLAAKPGDPATLDAFRRLVSGMKPEDRDDLAAVLLAMIRDAKKEESPR